MKKSESDKDGWVPTYRGTVFPWHCDHIGHMNVMWFVGKFDEATWQLFSRIGITSCYIRTQNRGMAGLEQRISYQRELRAGDVISIRSGVLEMREKVIRYVHEMRNDETDERSAMMIVTSVHMDTEKRKSCPFPNEILESGRAMIVPFDLENWGFREKQSIRVPQSVAAWKNRCGPPDFIKLDGVARRLTWVEYVGDGVFKSAGNVRATGSLTLLIPDFENGDGVELIGRAEYTNQRTDRRVDPLVQHRDPFPRQGIMTCEIRRAFRLRGLLHPRKRIEKALKITSRSTVDEQAPQ